MRRGIFIVGLVLLVAAPSQAATFRVAGTGVEDATRVPDGAIATSRGLFALAGVAETPDGGFLITSQGYIRKVDPGGRIRTLAGNGGNSGTPGDGGPASKATVDPEGIAALPDGSYMFADNVRAVRVVGTDGVINRLAGNGKIGFGGDGGPAVNASLDFPADVSPTPDGGYLVADQFNQRIRRVGPDGIITTVAGSGPTGNRAGKFAGDGGPATAARLGAPQGVAALPDGGFVIADTENGRVRQVGPDGVIRTLVSLGRNKGNVGDVAVMADGSIAFSGGGKIQKIATGGTLVPVGAGGGQIAPTADGGILSLGKDEVLYAAPAQPTRLATSISPRTFSTGTKPGVIFDSTLPAAATADLLQGSKKVRSVSGARCPTRTRSRCRRSRRGSSTA